MTPEDKQAEAIAAALVRRQPWYAKPQVYAATVGLAFALPFVCPRLPVQAQPLCEYVHGVAHQLVGVAPSSTTSPATSSGSAVPGADGG